MKLPEINEDYADFVLNYAKTDGLNSLVRKLGMNSDNSKLEADLQPDLIQAFSIHFPDIDLTELDNTVEWVLAVSAAKMKENKNGSRNE